MGTDETLSVPEVTRILGLRQATVRLLIKRGELRANVWLSGPMGRCPTIRIPVAALDAYIAASRVK